MTTSEQYKRGDAIKLLYPYQPLNGLVSGISYGDPRLYQIECVDGTRLQYVEATQITLQIEGAGQ
mgnify:CR=1 FL=1|tara:strand:- start:500 stop:694 length:195 start_codon:yes stop_codon:yes gene_type:complete